MQALIELLIGFFALLATTALAQFGVDIQPTSRAPEREIHRVSDCGTTPAKSASTTTSSPPRC